MSSRKNRKLRMEEFVIAAFFFFLILLGPMIPILQIIQNLIFASFPSSMFFIETSLAPLIPSLN